MTLYSRVKSGPTPQSEKADARQVKNNAGGYTFTLDCWKRLDRFLILGTEGGQYYAGEREHTKQAITAVDECIASDGPRTVRRIVEISDAGRAPKNDPAIFALACCASASDPATRSAALGALPKVCRIGTHLFHFVADVNAQRKWSRQLRSAVAAWYTEKPADKLAYQLAKYQQRDGWSHKDVLRLSHPKSPTAAHDAAFRWATSGYDSVSIESKYHRIRGQSYAGTRNELPALLQAMQEIHSGVGVNRAIELIREYRMPHECIPNEIKDKPEVWEALFDGGMGHTAMIRNLAKMTSIGLIKPLSSFTSRLSSQLTNEESIAKGRVHPLQILLALTTYKSGHGIKGSLTWSPVQSVVDALDDAFYRSFKAIEPTGKRIFLALDISGSMDSKIANTNLSCREACAALAMVTARTEKDWYCAGFTAGIGGYGGLWSGNSATLTNIPISPKMRLDEVVRVTSALPMGGTDCSLPMQYAIAQKLDVDAFCVYTDNETWAGKTHPHEALTQYRQRFNKNAKLIVNGMTATSFSIADPNDSGSMDVVGLDSATPSLIADFIADRGIV